MHALTDFQCTALCRCYALLLKRRAERLARTQQETEDAGEFADLTASPGSATITGTDGFHSVPGSADKASVQATESSPHSCQPGTEPPSEGGVR